MCRVLTRNTSVLGMEWGWTLVYCASRIGGIPQVSRQFNRCFRMHSTAIADIVRGLGRADLWLRMGWREVIRRYRRTTFGPFWSTLSVAIFVGTIGAMYATVWNQDVKIYLPYLAAGYIIWTFLAGLIMECGGAFIAADGILKQIKIPYTVFICTTILRNLFFLMHNLVVFVIVALLLPVEINWNTLLFIPGLLLLSLNTFWFGILVALLCARFRDIPQIITSVLQITFFVTPIFWAPELVPGARPVFIYFNPFYHLISIVREPLMGKVPLAISYYATAGMFVVGSAIALFVFSKYYRRIVYWL